MPYSSNAELPDNIKSSLPKGAQDIYRNAFNNAHEQYKDPSKRKGNVSREESAHKVAWSAVKQKYEKEGDTWKKK